MTAVYNNLVKAVHKGQELLHDGVALVHRFEEKNTLCLVASKVVLLTASTALFISLVGIPAFFIVYDEYESQKYEARSLKERVEPLRLENEQQIAGLQQELEQAERNLTEQQTRAERVTRIALETERAAGQRIIQGKDAQIGELATTAEQRGVRIIELERQLTAQAENAQRRANALNQNARQSDVELRMQGNLLNQERQKVQAKATELEQLRQQLQEKEQQIGRLSEEVQKAKEVEGRTQESSTTETRELERQLQETRVDLAEYTKAHETMSSHVDSLNEKIKQLTQELEQKKPIELPMPQVQKKPTELPMPQVAEIVAFIAKDRIVRDEEQDKEIEKLRGENNSLKIVSLQKEEEIKKAEKRVDKAHKQVEEKQKELEELETKYETSQEERDQLGTIVEEKKTEIIAKKEEAQKYYRELNEAQKQLDVAMKALETQEGELGGFREKIKELEKALAEKKTSAEGSSSTSPTVQRPKLPFLQGINKGDVKLRTQSVIVKRTTTTPEGVAESIAAAIESRRTSINGAASTADSGDHAWSSEGSDEEHSTEES